MKEKIQTFQNLPQKRVCLTAYTFAIAQMAAKYVDLILVGDSMGMVLYGMDSTQPVSLDMIINHAKAVRKGAPETLVIVDMPYGSYEASPEQALTNAKRIMDETECDGIKLEGGETMAPTIKTLAGHNIPVMGHIGLQPQSAPDEGGFKIKGKTSEQIQKLHRDAKAIEDAGVFSFVLEGTIEPVAAELTKETQTPTIGIGASIECDGQILVTEDMLGITGGHVPKFVKQYADLKTDISKAMEQYSTDVKSGTFPSDKYVYRQNT